MAERARVSCVDRNHAMQKYNNKLNYRQKTEKNDLRILFKDARKADNVIFYAEDFIREKDVKDAIEREVGKYNSIGKNTNELPNVYMFDGEKLVRIK